MSSVREIMRDIRDQLAHPLTHEQQQKTILQAQRVAHALRSEYQGRVQDVVLFGGFARGDAVDLSDVDLAVKWHSDSFKFDVLSCQLDASIKKIAQSLGLAYINFHTTPIGPQWLEQPRKCKKVLKGEVLKAIRIEGKSLIR